MRALNLSYTDELLAAIRAIAASVSTLQSLSRKRSKGYAPHLVAGGVDTTSSEEEQGAVLSETGAPTASLLRRLYYARRALTLSVSLAQAIQPAHACHFRQLLLKQDTATAKSLTKAVRNYIHVTANA